MMVHYPIICCSFVAEIKKIVSLIDSIHLYTFEPFLFLKLHFSFQLLFNYLLINFFIYEFVYWQP